MASKSPKAKLEKFIQQEKGKSIYADARFNHISPGCFEVWYGPEMAPVVHLHDNVRKRTMGSYTQYASR